uniref:Uncharacterized protein n=1 Tax=Aegilops tauschii subsp. strangulata TaxID=200361 RepID=A0A453BR98_AEGTS
FDRGYYLLVKAIQELRERKDGLVSSPSASAGLPAPARPGRLEPYSPPPLRPCRDGCSMLSISFGKELIGCSFGAGGAVLRSLAEKVASVLGCVVIVSMENYRTGAGADEGSDIDSIDFDALACNLQVRVRFSRSRSTCGWDWMRAACLL